MRNLFICICLFLLPSTSSFASDHLYAKLNESNLVTEVIASANSDGETLYPSTVGGIWKRGEMAASSGIFYRKNQPGIGYTFDSSVQPDGAFIPPKSLPSWILDTDTYLWKPPVPYPSDGKRYNWDEASRTWILNPRN